MDQHDRNVDEQLNDNSVQDKRNHVLNDGRVTRLYPANKENSNVFDQNKNNVTWPHLDNVQYDVIPVHMDGELTDTHQSLTSTYIMPVIQQSPGTEIDGSDGRSERLSEDNLDDQPKIHDETSSENDWLNRINGNDYESDLCNRSPEEDPDDSSKQCDTVLDDMCTCNDSKYDHHSSNEALAEYPVDDARHLKSQFCEKKDSCECSSPTCANKSGGDMWSVNGTESVDSDALHSSGIDDLSEMVSCMCNKKDISDDMSASDGGVIISDAMNNYFDSHFRNSQELIISSSPNSDTCSCPWHAGHHGVSSQHDPTHDLDFSDRSQSHSSCDNEINAQTLLKKCDSFDDVGDFIDTDFPDRPCQLYLSSSDSSTRCTSLTDSDVGSEISPDDNDPDPDELECRPLSPSACNIMKRLDNSNKVFCFSRSPDNKKDFKIKNTQTEKDSGYNLLHPHPDESYCMTISNEGLVSNLEQDCDNRLHVPEQAPLETTGSTSQEQTTGSNSDENSMTISNESSSGVSWSDLEMRLCSPSELSSRLCQSAEGRSGNSSVVSSCVESNCPANSDSTERLCSSFKFDSGNDRSSDCQDRENYCMTVSNEGLITSCLSDFGSASHDFCSNQEQASNVHNNETCRLTESNESLVGTCQHDNEVEQDPWNVRVESSDKCQGTLLAENLRSNGACDSQTECGHNGMNIVKCNHYVLDDSGDENITNTDFQCPLCQRKSAQSNQLSINSRHDQINQSPSIRVYLPVARICFQEPTHSHHDEFGNSGHANSHSDTNHRGAESSLKNYGVPKLNFQHDICHQTEKGFSKMNVDRVLPLGLRYEPATNAQDGCAEDMNDYAENYPIIGEGLFCDDFDDEAEPYMLPQHMSLSFSSDHSISNSNYEPIYEELDAFHGDEDITSTEVLDKLLQKFKEKCQNEGKMRLNSQVEKVMIWNEYEAFVLQVKQIGTSACGPTAVLNILKACDFPAEKIVISDTVNVNLRQENAHIPEYLFSRSIAGTTADDLTYGIESATGGFVRGRFFHLFPEREINILKWLGYWIKKGGVPLVTLNLQKGVKAGWTIPDAWHHQMVYGVSSRGVHVTNPLEIISEDVIAEQLCSDSVLLIRRQDILSRFKTSSQLGELLTHPDPRWMSMNVLGQVVNVLRESSVPHAPGMKVQITSHISIPAIYRSGVTIFMRSDSDAWAELSQTPDLKLKANCDSIKCDNSSPR